MRFDPAARQGRAKQFGIPPDTYVIGALGRLDPNKRVDLMMEAAAPLLGERCKILVIGRGEDQARVEAAVKRLGVTDHVIFGGYQADTAAMLAAFDLYVAASLAGDVRAFRARGAGQRAARCSTPPARPWTGSRPSRARQVTGTAEALGAEIGERGGKRPKDPRS